MKFISLCSGIEAASVAFNPLGWEAICFAEIEPFPSALLQERFPHVPNMGDMSRYDEWPEEFFAKADMIVGGPPCQSFSVAGKRGGLDDDRGNLTLTFTELINHADRIRRKHNRPPVIVLYENVPGLLSDKTNAFGCLLGALAGEDDQLNPSGQRWTNSGAVLGPERSIAWRILDAQYFGLAQRRKRVFVVASAREGFCPAEVLFEFDGVRRDIAPSREEGEKASGNAREGVKSAGSHGELVGTLCARDSKGVGNQYVSEGKLVVSEGIGFRKLTFESYVQDETASTMMARDYKSYTDLVAFAQNTRDEVRYIGGDGQIAGALAANPGMKQTTCIAFNSRQDPVSGDVFGALDTCSPQAQAVAIVYPLNTMTMLGRPSDDLKPRMGLGIGKENDPQNTLSAAHCHAVAITCATKQQGLTTGENMASTLTASDYKEPQAVVVKTAVRRLTPIECERLQGFPDNYTQIPWRNKPASECPDGHRYKALGNSWAVPVVYWIGKRIAYFLNDTEITW